MNFSNETENARSSVTHSVVKLPRSVKAPFTIEAIRFALKSLCVTLKVHSKQHFVNTYMRRKLISPEKLPLSTSVIEFMLRSLPTGKMTHQTKKKRLMSLQCCHACKSRKVSIANRCDLVRGKNPMSD